jgi:multidrug resistance protein
MHSLVIKSLRFSRKPASPNSSLMAAHEILGAPAQPDDDQVSVETTMELEDDEKKEIGFPEDFTSNFDSSKVVLDETTPIVYHYLTFESTLPHPTRKTTNAVFPPPPDLKTFQSPFEWSSSRKNFTLWVSCIATCAAAYTAGSYSPPAAQMSAEWGVSETAVFVGITTFCCGFGIAPMILAPFSEINGRYPVFVGSGILFLICQICCAVTHSFPGMLVARFFAGCGSSVFSTMVGGIISDLYHAKDRNTPMAIFSGGALVGTGLGPLVSGFIAQNTNWRWVFWVQVITCGIVVGTVTLFFKETRGSILLSRKAVALNAYYGTLEKAGHYGHEISIVPSSEENALPRTEIQRVRWRVKSDEERESISKMISISIYRPFHLLVTEPVVFFFSLWVSFAWAVLYLTFGSVPLVFARSHGFTIDQSGSVFAAMSIGSALSTVLSIYQEHLLASLIKSINDGEATEQSKWTRKIGRLDLGSPEGRLYFTCVESILLPIGLFWFGWTQFSSIPWIVPTLSVGCATMGIFSIYLATFNYLADTYHRYASSALAAQSFCRNVLGGVFPLITPSLFNGLGFAPAASLLGGIGALLTIVPWVLVIYGPVIRARSRFASEIM